MEGDRPNEVRKKATGKHVPALPPDHRGMKASGFLKKFAPTQLLTFVTVRIIITVLFARRPSVT
ncbi:hypothetical protein EMIT07CA2_30574 [Brevibacillus sp. IT-7CA2]